MAQAIGTLYEVVNVPMRLYYASDRANVRNTFQSGWVTKAGSYKIINHVVGSDGVDLYAINDITNSYAIGWVRDDDNIQGVKLYNMPSQISTNDANYKIGLEGTKGIAYKYTAKIGTTVIHEEETTLTNPTTVKTFTLTTTIKNLIYTALGNNNTGVMNISAVSTHNGKTIRTSTSSITVAIPAENGPKFTTNPTVTVIGAIGGLAYRDISSVRVSVPTSSVSLKDGATLKSKRFEVGPHSHTTTTADNYTSPVIGSVGPIPIKVTVTDSRNRSTTFETSVTFNETQKINIDSFTAIRSGKTGIKITANGRYMPQIDGTPKYTITKSIRGKDTWSSVATGDVAVSNSRYSIAITQTDGLTATSAYDLRLVVSGTSTSATGTSVVGTEAVPISYGKHGSGVGVMFDNSNPAMLQVGIDGIDSEGPIVSKGEVYASGSNKAWHAGNDGDGSGLDADLLDGLHASDIQVSQMDNSNGYSLRFPNGVQIIGGKKRFAAVSNPSVVFPQSFAATPNVSLTVEQSNRWLRVMTSVTTLSNSGLTASVIDFDGMPVDDYILHYYCIGRWKVTT